MPNQSYVTEGKLSRPSLPHGNGGDLKLFSGREEFDTQYVFEFLGKPHCGHDLAKLYLLDHGELFLCLERQIRLRQMQFLPGVLHNPGIILD